MNKIQKKRLLNVARALREAEAKSEAFRDSFTFKHWGYANFNDYHCPEEFVNSITHGEIMNSTKASEIYDAFHKLVTEGTIPHNCGAPACALGHYAYRRDLQKTFTLSSEGDMRSLKNSCITSGVGSSVILKHFGITIREADKLFGSRGCEGAETPIAAAEYIESFVEKYHSNETRI